MKLVWVFPDQKYKYYNLFSNSQFRDVINVTNKKYGYGEAPMAE
jgi:hypothetical protein